MLYYTILYYILYYTILSYATLCCIVYGILYDYTKQKKARIILKGKSHQCLGCCLPRICLTNVQQWLQVPGSSSKVVSENLFKVTNSETRVTKNSVICSHYINSKVDWCQRSWQSKDTYFEPCRD